MIPREPEPDYVAFGRKLKWLAISTTGWAVIYGFFIWLVSR